MIANGIMHKKINQSGTSFACRIKYKNDEASPEIPVPDTNGPINFDGNTFRYPKWDTSPNDDPIPMNIAPVNTM